MNISPSAESKLRIQAAHTYAVLQSYPLDSWCVATSGISDLRCFKTKEEAITDRDALVEKKFQELKKEYEAHPGTGSPFGYPGNPVTTYEPEPPAPQVFKKTKRPLRKT